MDTSHDFDVLFSAACLIRWALYTPKPIYGQDKLASASSSERLPQSIRANSLLE